MGILLTILLGALIGWLASKVMHRDAEQGALGNILVGILGAFLGGILSNLLGGSADGDFLIGLNFADLFWAFLGAVALLAVVNLATRRRIR